MDITIAHTNAIHVSKRETLGRQYALEIICMDSRAQPHLCEDNVARDDGHHDSVADDVELCEGLRGRGLGQPQKQRRRGSVWMDASRRESEMIGLLEVPNITFMDSMRE